MAKDSRLHSGDIDLWGNQTVVFGNHGGMGPWGRRELFIFSST